MDTTELVKQAQAHKRDLAQQMAAVDVFLSSLNGKVAATAPGAPILVAPRRRRRPTGPLGPREAFEQVKEAVRMIFDERPTESLRGAVVAAKVKHLLKPQMHVGYASVKRALNYLRKDGFLTLTGTVRVVKNTGRTVGGRGCRWQKAGA